MAQDEYVVYYSKPKLAALTVFIVLIVMGLPLFLITEAYKHHTADAGMWVFLIPAELFFVPALCKAIRLLVDMPPALLINREGILDNTAIMGTTGWIPWENIARFEIKDNGMMRLLYITPRSQSALLKGKPLFTQFNMLTRKLWPGSPPINIMGTTLAVHINDICAEMQRCQPADNSTIIDGKGTRPA